MEIVGWIGTALVIIAYYPQIHHLWNESCAWGISIQTWLIWLVASVLLLVYCISRAEILLSVVQVSSIAAILLTIILVRKSNKICPHHLAKSGNIGAR
jgi:uncharacterized protein with PQ loop repeat